MVRGVGNQPPAGTGDGLRPGHLDGRVFDHPEAKVGSEEARRAYEAFLRVIGRFEGPARESPINRNELIDAIFDSMHVLSVRQRLGLYGLIPDVYLTEHTKRMKKIGRIWTQLGLVEPSDFKVRSNDIEEATKQLIRLAYDVMGLYTQNGSLPHFAMRRLIKSAYAGEDVTAVRFDWDVSRLNKTDTTGSLADEFIPHVDGWLRTGIINSADLYALFGNIPPEAAQFPERTSFAIFGSNGRKSGMFVGYILNRLRLLEEDTRIELLESQENGYLSSDVEIMAVKPRAIIYHKILQLKDFMHAYVRENGLNSLEEVPRYKVIEHIMGQLDLLAAETTFVKTHAVADAVRIGGLLVYGPSALPDRGHAKFDLLERFRKTGRGNVPFGRYGYQDEKDPRTRVKLEHPDVARDIRDLSSPMRITRTVDNDRIWDWVEGMQKALAEDQDTVMAKDFPGDVYELQQDEYPEDVYELYKEEGGAIEHLWHWVDAFTRDPELAEREDLFGLFKRELANVATLVLNMGEEARREFRFTSTFKSTRRIDGEKADFFVEQMSLMNGLLAKLGYKDTRYDVLAMVEVDDGRAFGMSYPKADHVDGQFQIIKRLLFDVSKNMGLFPPVVAAEGDQIRVAFSSMSRKGTRFNPKIYLKKYQAAVKEWYEARGLSFQAYAKIEDGDAVLRIPVWVNDEGEFHTGEKAPEGFYGYKKVVTVTVAWTLTPDLKTESDATTLNSRVRMGFRYVDAVGKRKNAHGCPYRKQGLSRIPEGYFAAEALRGGVGAGGGSSRVKGPCFRSMPSMSMPVSQFGVPMAAPSMLSAGMLAGFHPMAMSMQSSNGFLRI